MSVIKRCRVCGKKVTGNFKFYCSVKCRHKYYNSKRPKKELRERMRKNNDEKRLSCFSKKDLIQCKICGRWFRQVGTHVVQVHKMTAREYRERFGFDVKRGQLPEDYRKLKAELAIITGTYKNLLKGKKYWFKKGDKNIGKYKRSIETLERLLQQIKLAHNVGKFKNCLICGKELSGQHRKFCSTDCRRLYEKRIQESKRLVKLFKDD